MKKDFYYNVNGTEFHDTEAFGKAWKEAKALAAPTFISSTMLEALTIKAPLNNPGNTK